MASGEISFELVDEDGGHFQGLRAPYDDHLCAAGGDLFAHPTQSPTYSSAPTPPFPTASPAPRYRATPPPLHRLK
jgi:hypothetical protein